MSDFRLSLVLPAWNEQERMQQAIEEAESSLSGKAGAYEIIVVDDGSSDRTADVVRAEAARNPHVRLVQHPDHRGYGAALRSGLQAATLDLVAVSKVDGEFDLNTLDYLLPLTQRFDVTCGYPLERQDPPLRRVLSWGYNTLAGVLLGTPVQDVDAAVKIFHRNQVPSILPECDQFFAGAEMLARAKMEGLSIGEVSVHQRPRRARTSAGTLRKLPRTVFDLLSFWWSRLLFPAEEPAVGPITIEFWAGLILLLLMAGSLLFLNLSYPLLEPDEGRYAEITRVMATSGDWIVPRINHEPFLDKPPLFYWLVAGCFRLFGTTALSARLVSASAAFLTILAVYFFGRRIMGTRAAFLSALALCLMVGFIQCGRIVILDSLLTFFVTITLFTAYEAIRGKALHSTREGPTHKPDARAKDCPSLARQACVPLSTASSISWGWWLTSALCCALGVLTKGPIAFVLLAPPVAAYLWLNGQTARLKLIHWAVFAAIVACLVSPWYIAITLRDPKFAYYFFIDQHLVRFFMKEYHVEPPWFYIPVLLLGCLPCSLLLLHLTRFLFSRSAAVRSVRPPSMGFFLLWAGWCVFFFSISSSKLPPYVVPAMPALALVVGSYLEQLLFPITLAVYFQQLRSLVARQGVATLAGIGLVMSVGVWFLHLIGTAELVFQAALCTGCLVALAVWGRRLPWRVGWLLGCVLGALLVIEPAHVIVPAWSHQHDPLIQSEKVERLLRDSHVGVVCYGGSWGTVPFALNRDDNILNFAEQPAEELTAFLVRHPRNLIVLRQKEQLEFLRPALPPGMDIIALADAGKNRIVLVQPIPLRHGNAGKRALSLAQR